MGTCRLCGHQHMRDKFRIREVTVRGCAACGFVQVQEQPAPDDLCRLYSQSYFEHGKYTDTFALRKEHERRLGLVRRHGVAPGARVLDAGCATGEFIEFARGHYDMWGLDVSTFAAEQARLRNPGLASQIRSGYVEDQDYPNGFFDAIVMWDVLEHLWNPVEACRKLIRTLAPGGKLFLSTPNIGSMAARRMGPRWALMTVPEHLGFFDRSTMALLIQQQLQMELLSWQSLGKWVNLGFFLYKAKRIFPRAVPQTLINVARARPLSWVALYVPTGDIQYAAAAKQAKREGC